MIESWEEKYEREKAERAKRMIRVKAALAAKGIKLYAGGCGCCDSPWLKIEIDGELIWDDEGVQFDMLGVDDD